MREPSLLVSVVLCLPTLARTPTKETIIPARSLLECTLEEPNFSSASAGLADPLICHTRGVQEFGPRGVLHMSVCAKVDWRPPFVAATTARVAVAVVGYNVT